MRLGIILTVFAATILFTSTINIADAGTAPSAHTQLELTAFKNEIRLFFAGSNFEDGVTFDGRFRNANSTGTFIERSADGGVTFSTLTTVNATQTFIDQTVLPNTAYFYRITAQNATGSSGTFTSASSASSYGGSAVFLCPLDCTPPTLGVDSNGNRVVDGGFTYNGDTMNVQQFYTPMELVTVTVGEENLATLKIFDNSGADNITHAELAFGLAYGNLAIQQSTASIFWDKSGIVETVTLADPENALENVRVESSIENNVLTLDIYHTFRQPLDFNMLGTYVWDTNRNGWQNYYNHGVEIVGDSMNPPKQFEGIYKGKIHHLIEVETNHAIDEYGDMWTFTSGKWFKDYVKPEQTEDTAVNVMTRNHSAFEYQKQEQIRLAEEQMKIICPSCLLSYDDFESSFTHVFVGKVDKLDKQYVLDIMQSEALKAQEKLNILFDQPP